MLPLQATVTCATNVPICQPCAHDVAQSPLGQGNICPRLLIVGSVVRWMSSSICSDPDAQLWSRPKQRRVQDSFLYSIYGDAARPAGQGGR